MPTVGFPELVGSAGFSIIHQLEGLSRISLAYLDPGTGSLIIQASLAAALSVPFVLRSRFVAVVKRLRALTRNGSGAGRARQG